MLFCFELCHGQTQSVVHEHNEAYTKWPPVADDIF